ncbi:M28 family peptidase [Nonomuraea endophytica]|uniref:M28 family peptidase n=1 Tax=Nonomuraea endophytica TaxID=714136 RepID=UPI0037CBB7DF
MTSRWVLACAPADGSELLTRAAHDGAAGGVAGWMPKMIAGRPLAAVALLAVRPDIHQQMLCAADGEATMTASIPLRSVDVPGANIYADLVNGQGRPTVLLTAHYDGVGDDPHQRLPAAAGNASGVAVVLEAAHHLRQHPPPGLNLALAFLDAEDGAQDLIAELAAIDAEPDIAPNPDTGAGGDGKPGADTGTDTGEEPVADRASVADLAARNAQVAWAPDRDLWHELLYRPSGRRLYRRYRTPARLPRDAPWTDTPSEARHTWRTRAAYLAGEFAFGVDYQVCRICKLGWVEDPYTLPKFQRCGLARAALAALRGDYAVAPASAELSCPPVPPLLRPAS